MANTKYMIELLRYYAKVLESGEAELEANTLDVNVESIDITTCEDKTSVFEAGDSNHHFSIDLKIHPSKKVNVQRLQTAASRALAQMCRASAPDNAYTDAVDDLDAALNQ